MCWIKRDQETAPIFLRILQNAIHRKTLSLKGTIKTQIRVVVDTEVFHHRRAVVSYLEIVPRSTSHSKNAYMCNSGSMQATFFYL